MHTLGQEGSQACCMPLGLLLLLKGIVRGTLRAGVLLVLAS